MYLSIYLSIYIYIYIYKHATPVPEIPAEVTKPVGVGVDDELGRDGRDKEYVELRGRRRVSDSKTVI